MFGAPACFLCCYCSMQVVCISAWGVWETTYRLEKTRRAHDTVCGCACICGRTSVVVVWDGVHLLHVRPSCEAELPQ